MLAHSPARPLVLLPAAACLRLVEQPCEGAAAGFWPGQEAGEWYGSAGGSAPSTCLLVACRPGAQEDWQWWPGLCLLVRPPCLLH